MNMVGNSSPGDRTERKDDSEMYIQLKKFRFNHSGLTEFTPDGIHVVSIQKTSPSLA